MTLTKEHHQAIYLELDREVNRLRRQWVKIDNQAIAGGYALAGTPEGERLAAKSELLRAAYMAARHAASEYFVNYL